MKVTVTTTLNQGEVEEIIRKYFEDKGESIDKFDFKIKMMTMGYGPGEYDYHVFDGLSFTQEREI